MNDTVGAARWGVLLAASLVLAACGGGGESADYGVQGGSILAVAPTVLRVTSSAAVDSATPAPATVVPAETTGATTAVTQALAAAAPADPSKAVAVVQTTSSASSGLSYTFTLDQPRMTSAAVYASNGALVRTLWRGETLGPGQITRVWDQRDDQGQTVAPDDFTIRVVHHNVRYVWEGVVGNSSERAGAAVAHKSFHMPVSLAASGRQMHYSVGYNEWQNALNGFDLGNPQLNNAPLSLGDAFVAAAMIAVDANRLYWANTGGIGKSSFIAAFDLAARQPAAFSAGAAVCLNRWPNSNDCYPGQKYDSVLELRPTLDSVPTGLAVQRAGRLLAVAYGADNQIRLLDKDSGKWLLTISVPLSKGGTNQLAFSPAGDLWVVSGNSLRRYTDLGATPSLAATVAGLVSPLAIAVDPQNEDAVWVADGGASQQVKRFDRFGVARGMLGRAGGLAGRAAVADDTLCFADGPVNERTALEVDSTGAIWVVDTCNNRIVQLSAQGTLLNQIAYLPAVYVATADSGNATRVFANYLEFAVDYSKPLNDPKSWVLVRNWLTSLPAALRDGDSANSGFGGLRTVQTLGNGRTYAQVSANNNSYIVELLADGSMRSVKTLRAPQAGESPMVLYENGDLGYAYTDSSRQTVFRLPIDRFDSRGDPVWASQPLTLASVPNGASTPAHHNGTFAGARGPRFPLTASGRVLFFNASVDADSGFHLGAAAAGAASWLWQASPSAPLDGRGAFQTRKSDANIQYGGNMAMAVGTTVIYGYHGEFYTDLNNGRVGQANQFMHFRDDGLFIGQFGVASTQAQLPSQPGLSGNAFSPTLLRYGGQTYLYHNDESSHGGVHRWRLAGLDDIKDLAGRSGLNSAVNLR